MVLDLVQEEAAALGRRMDSIQMETGQSPLHHAETQLVVQLQSFKHPVLTLGGRIPISRK